MDWHFLLIELILFLAVGWMVFLGLLFFWLISLFVKWEKVPLRDLGGLALAAIFGILLNQMLFVMGLEFASPVEAAIVVTFTPILTMMLSALFLREPITWLKAVGVFLGLSGAVLMIAGKYWFGGAEGQAGQNSVLGIVCDLPDGVPESDSQVQTYHGHALDVPFFGRLFRAVLAENGFGD